MILHWWAERLLHAPGPPDVIDLHVKDVVAAFLTGLRTHDGRAIVGRHNQTFDRTEQAAAVAAIARLSECDCIDLASCVTPGAVVIPVALVLAGARDASEVDRAVAAGYAAGLRLGAAIGGARALARGIWPTLLAAPVMAAVTASVLAGSDSERLAHAIALALAGADGRVGDRAVRWKLLADSVLRGLRAADAAAHGARGDLDLLPEDADWEAAADASIVTTGFKPFPIARQGANAVAAFQHLLSQRIQPEQIDAVEVFVPPINVALLTRPVSETDRLSRLCNMGLQLAAAALAPDLLYDPERPLTPGIPLLESASRVSVAAASDLEAHWPDRWPARVVIRVGTRQLEATVIRAPFDHDGPDLSRMLTDKWRRLLAPQDASLLLERRATLWEQFERRISMPAEE
jgi:2-methylcitrate dehydratase PrpD